MALFIIMKCTVPGQKAISPEEHAANILQHGPSYVSPSHSSSLRWLSTEVQVGFEVF